MASPFGQFGASSRSLPGVQGLTTGNVPALLSGQANVGNLASLSGAGGGSPLSLTGSSMPSFSATGGLPGATGTQNFDASGLQSSGVSSSTLQLMAQIATMMASVLSGITQFIQTLMASTAARQQQAAATGTPATGSPGASPSPGATPSPSPASGAAPTGNGGAPSSKGFQLPLAKGSYSLGDGLGAGRDHGGQDLPAASGTPVLAAKDGVLERREDPGGYGTYAVIKHPDGSETLYGHLSAYGQFETGQQVKAGDVIGKVGSTGRSTGPHLHFEIKLNGNRVEPREYVNF